MLIDHIGIVVSNMENAIAFWQNTFGYKQKTTTVVNTRQKVRVVFLGKEHSLDIKLVEPLDQNSTIFRFSARGGGLHHVCFKCHDVAQTVDELKDHQVRILSRPAPGEAFNNAEIAFMLGAYNLNFELIDTDLRAGLLT